MKTTLLSLGLLLPLLSQAIEPVRYEASYQQGRNGAIDMATTKCTMDVVLIHETTGSKAIFILWSDPYAKVSYKIYLPLDALPLQNGYQWINPNNGTHVSYENETLSSKSLNEVFQVKISPNGYFPTYAVGKNTDASGTYLECAF